MDAVGREREQTLIPALNSSRRCMEWCWNNLISTAPHTWVRHSSHRRGQTGWEWGHAQLHTPLHAAGTGHLSLCFGDREGAHQARGNHALASKDSFNGKERGKDFRTPARSKGHLTQKVLKGFVAQSKNKRHPLKYSERKIVLGRKRRGCGKG